MNYLHVKLIRLLKILKKIIKMICDQILDPLKNQISDIRPPKKSDISRSQKSDIWLKKSDIRPQQKINYQIYITPPKKSKIRYHGTPVPPPPPPPPPPHSVRPCDEVSQPRSRLALGIFFAKPFGSHPKILVSQKKPYYFCIRPPNNYPVDTFIIYNNNNGTIKENIYFMLPSSCQGGSCLSMTMITNDINAVHCFPRQCRVILVVF